MKAVQEVKEYIRGLGEGKSFTARSLWHLAHADNVRQILSRMVQSGEITRLSRGLYVVPKVHPKVGATFPSIREITELIAETTGETIGIHGAEAARMLQLTTQVPMRLIFHTTGYTRRIKVRSQTVLLKHVNPSKLVEAGTIAGTVISAFLYLGKKLVSENTVQKVKNQLSPEEFETVLKEIEHMPAWMANVFYNYRKMKSDARKIS